MIAPNRATLAQFTAPWARQVTRLLLSSFFILHPSSLLADTLHGESWQIECSRPAPHDITIMRGESLTLFPQFLERGVALTLTNASAVALRFRDTTLATGLFYSVPGTISDATNGYISIPLTATNFPAATVYTYTIAARSASGDNLRGFGTIRIQSTVGGTSTNTPTVYAPTPWTDALAIIGTNVSATNSTHLGGIPAAGYVQTNNPALTNARPPEAHTQGWDSLTGTPPTLANATNALQLGGIAAADYALIVTPTNYFTWTSDGTNVTLTGYTGPTGPAVDIVIPETLDGLPVTTAGNVFLANATLNNFSAQTLTTVGTYFLASAKLNNFSTETLTTAGDHFLDGATLNNFSAPVLTTAGNYVLSGVTLNNFSAPILTTAGGNFLDSATLYDLSMPLYAGTYGPVTLRSSTFARTQDVWNAFSQTSNDFALAVSNITPAQINAVSNTPAGIAGANGVTNRVPIPLTYASTNIYTDASIANTFRVTLTNNATLQLPTGATDGQTIRWWITQGKGSNTLNVATTIVYPTGTTNLALSTATGSKDLLIGEYDGSTTNLHLTGLLLFAR